MAGKAKSIYLTVLPKGKHMSVFKKVFFEAIYIFYLYFNYDVFSGLPDFWHPKLWRPFSKGRSWSQFFHVFSAGQHSRNLFNADGLFLSELLGPQDLVEQIERTFRR